EGFTRLLKLNLEQTGTYEVRVENHGTNAIAAAREFKPDLILLDVVLPDMDGGQIAEHLREDPALRTIPIIYLTAIVSQSEVDEKAGMIGGRVFVAKPVSKDVLIKVIEKQLAAAASA
ncbi:MAG: response regulator, partial [Candidatus Binatia bacterium]